MLGHSLPGVLSLRHLQTSLFHDVQDFREMSGYKPTQRFRVRHGYCVVPGGLLNHFQTHACLGKAGIKRVTEVVPPKSLDLLFLKRSLPPLLVYPQSRRPRRPEHGLADRRPVPSR